MNRQPSEDTPIRYQARDRQHDEQPQFVMSLNTAKALGLTIPPSLLLRADEILQ